ncbi:nitric oxide reductase NorQ protein [Paraburkholderia caballeronis]|uniref:CbbQ/NirQ/NorQ/GpvN family protein n=1 Tax=Paraburkholderia caballeronis TaxID=416943 RepID=UPI001065A2B5|nr:CbbQ/NirQ/NorQ/GpvN family protein [Paraburkholderia caballeronis]TDV35871.1 nitric oxide reductase NorQ protein [Paraburkholderia caballeronis]
MTRPHATQAAQAQTSLDAWRIASRPWYEPAGDELECFEAASAARLPVMLKGPTGCGKTRLVEHVAWRLGRPLVTIACHEDLTASDLVGRYLLDGNGTYWQDGPLTQAVRHGAICYLDEVVEARQDTTVVIHPLTDARRVLPVDRRGELIAAHPDFMLVVSFNPHYQHVSKNLKPSTRQRFVALDLDWPGADAETRIVAHEGGIDAERAATLVAVARRTRGLDDVALPEGASTRMLVYAATLIARGMAEKAACRIAIVQPLTDDAAARDALLALVDGAFR